MLELFLISTKRFIGLMGSSLTASPDGHAALRPRRLLIMLGFLPIFAFGQALHWLGFLLDDLFFRGWRRVRVEAPLFVLGVPRSGTTRLHQVLAQDEQFTTFRTWECLFAPSVTQRLFFRALARADRAIGAPMARLLSRLERRVFAGLDDVHPMGLTTPEEDYFALMPVLSCFILALPFPQFKHIWRVGRFDADLEPAERERLLDFYESCLKRHLYVQGDGKRLLSKNAAFASMAQSLAQRFPDARFIVSLRDPLETLPSQLSSIEAGLAFFGVPADSEPVRQRLTAQLAFYYENLDRLREQLPASRHAALGMQDLRGGLGKTLKEVYERFALPVSADFDLVLAQEDRRARSYKSSHHYSLEQFGLTPASVSERFAAAYRHPVLASAVAPRTAVAEARTATC
ncbi:MAG: sulfotransferase [Lamprobacter sp.]|uniref:sulfotransferase n=1 Tax=Lamprobacter sp. TaxID=3100796 RepID=UPI002B25FDA0|nr:sulfotransferase [Lamprobacter sp.]MEA3638848.1 sulfotransferase [Lamprobacter sp.]